MNTTRTVSYTHLDVYKRQELCNDRLISNSKLKTEVFISIRKTIWGLQEFLRMETNVS